jgi:2-oxo-4-hydroxy-4-carboxy--5-ureidoimidazoline (OHCU) decarboxylase
VKRVIEYRKHADECRALAARMVLPEQQKQLLEMAAVWEQLAEERSDLLRDHPELAGK